MRRLACLAIILLLLSLSAVSAQEGGVYEGSFTFNYPSDWTQTVGNDLVQVGVEGVQISVYGPANYAKVIATSTFEDDGAALAFFVDRAGFEAGDAVTDDLKENELARVAVEFPRREQSGFASLLDLQFDRRSVVVYLHGEDAADDAFDQVLTTLVYPPDLVDVASSNADFSTLVAAVQAAGLVDTLRGGSYTVFAPTNEAFAKAMAEMGMTPEEVLGNPEVLTAILTYHVVEGVVTSDALAEGKVTTVQGDPINVSFTRTGGVRVNNANVVTADVTAANGVIHVIDAVLLPPDVLAAQLATTMGETLKRKTKYNGPYVFDYPVGVKQSEAAGVVTLERGEFTLIVISPEKYAQILGTSEQADSNAALLFFLDRAGYEAGEAIEAPEGIAAAATVSLSRRGQAGTAWLKELGYGRTGVVIALAGRDGFALALRDAVGTMVATSLNYPADLVDIAGDQEGLTMFLSAVEAAGLTDTLRTGGPFTVFAPTDEAFVAAVGALGLSPEEVMGNTELLTGILQYHLLEGTKKAVDLTSGDVPTVLGQNVAVVSDGATVAVNGANVITADVAARNGVIHIVDAVLVPTLCAVNAPADGIRVRLGPSGDRAALGFITVGVDIPVSGQSTDAGGVLWYQIDKDLAVPGNQATTAWVNAADVTVVGPGCSLIPVVGGE